MWPRIAAFGRTVQFIFAFDQAVDFHLTAVESFLADNAEAPVIERSPVSRSIFITKDRQPIIEFKMGDHDAKSSLLVASTDTIGTLDDCVVRQNPKRHLIRL